MSSILQFDQTLLYYINQVWTSPGLDTFFLFITNMHRELLAKWLLFPFIIFLVIKTSKAFWWSRLLMIIVGIAITDSMSHRLIKPYFARPRPQQEMTLQVRPVGEAQGFSFPSNHSINLFLSATLLSLFYRRKFWLFYSIAVLISYSRVYLGVHYPSDILGGAVLGVTVALLLSHFWPFTWRENS